MASSYTEKLNALRAKIEETVLPLINGDIHLTNLPYHANLGDSLIWRGTEDILQKSCHKILSRTSFLSWNFPKIKSDEIIVINGGGNFGDIWRIIMDVFLQIITRYPDNRIIILSQSGWYDDTSLIKSDATALARHKDLHLIARDTFTYDIFKTHFAANHCYLAPDMAFGINYTRINQWCNVKPSKNTLYLRRVDKEWVKDTEVKATDGTHISDWPTISSPRFHEKIFFAALNRTMFRIGHDKAADSAYWPIVNTFGKSICLGRMPGRAAKFIASYENIITTRLHTLILATLLGKKVSFIDNSTHKLSAFHHTWLKSFDNVTPYGS